MTLGSKTPGVGLRTFIVEIKIPLGWPALAHEAGHFWACGQGYSEIHCFSARACYQPSGPIFTLQNLAFVHA